MKRIIISLIFILANNALSYDPLRASMLTSTSGMKAQSKRLQIITQNIANKDSVATNIDGKPYRRKLVILKVQSNRGLGAETISAKESTDKSAFRLIYDPNHPFANIEGYVEYPNIDLNIENADSKNTIISYEANVNMIETAKNLYLKTIDLIK
jgi:flagellar basal-body rod protein FlgC